MSKLHHVRYELEQARNFFRNKRNYNRARVFWLSFTTAALSALATFSIGATKILDFEWLQVVALAATSVVTVVGVWESVFSYRKLWDLNNAAMADLDRLKRLIDYRVAAETTIPDHEVDQFFAELEGILSRADHGWVATYAADRPAPTSSDKEP